MVSDLSSSNTPFIRCSCLEVLSVSLWVKFRLSAWLSRPCDLVPNYFFLAVVKHMGGLRTTTNNTPVPLHLSTCNEASRRVGLQLRPREGLLIPHLCISPAYPPSSHWCSWATSGFPCRILDPWRTFPQCWPASLKAATDCLVLSLKSSNELAPTLEWEREREAGSGILATFSMCKWETRGTEHSSTKCNVRKWCLYSWQIDFLIDLWICVAHTPLCVISDAVALTSRFTQIIHVLQGPTWIPPLP